MKKLIKENSQWYIIFIYAFLISLFCYIVELDKRFNTYDKDFLELKEDLIEHEISYKHEYIPPVLTVKINGYYIEDIKKDIKKCQKGR